MTSAHTSDCPHHTASHPLFSIVTVTLNAGEALGRTVDSLKQQTCRDYEHIVKDGGSKDGAVERYVIADDYYRPLVIHKPDGGIYDAMNQALDVARGEYVLFLNAGDCLYGPKALTAVAEAVHSDPEVAMVYGDTFCDPLQMLIRNPRRLTSFRLFRSPLCHQCCFVRRGEINQLGRFETSFKVLADYDLLVRLVVGLRARTRYCDETLVSYMGDGFSDRPAVRQLAMMELTRLRMRGFSLPQRVLFSALWHMTLPSLRIRLMRSKRFLSVRRSYLRAANQFRSRLP